MTAKKLTRSTQDKWLGGVCGGIAAYFGWDATLVRLVALVAVLVTLPVSVVAYIVAWVIMPQEPATPWQTETDAPSGPVQ